MNPNELNREDVEALTELQREERTRRIDPLILADLAERDLIVYAELHGEGGWMPTEAGLAAIDTYEAKEATP